MAYANDALDAWASWVRSHQGAWPARTLLARIMKEGAWGAAHGASMETMPEPVLLTDRAVARIPVDLRHVVKVYYLTYAASEMKAARCKCSRATFWRKVERAQIAVYRELSNLADRETPAYKFQAFLQTASL